MKTYTHPTINLPAGAVVVKFFDPDGTGTETTPKIIEEIGDVEDGFDINLGELYVSTCDFVLHNKNNYTVGTLLNSNRLYVGVIVDNESYFYGEVDMGSIATDNDKDPSTNLSYSKISFSANKIFASMQNTLAYQFEDFVYEDLILHEYFTETGTGFIFLYYQTLFYVIAQLCGLKSTAETDVVFDCNRQYYEGLTDTYVELNRLIFKRNNFAAPLPLNKYRDRLDNAFSILGELCREFGLYPDVIYDGTNFKFLIREIDSSRLLTAPVIKGRQRLFKYLIKSVYTDLDQIPPALNVLDFQNVQTTTKPFGDDFEMFMHHTNYYATDGVSWESDYLFKIKDPSATSSMSVDYIKNYGDATAYTTHQQAMFNHYKNIFYNNSKWFMFSVKGLKGTYSAATKLEYLAPGFKFTDNGRSYLIHSTKKSLRNNMSELSALDIGAA